MRDVVVSTRPLSYRSAGSIRSLPTTCTHEARRGRGSYTTGREILSPLHPPTSLSLTRPLLSLSLSLIPLPSSTSFLTPQQQRAERTRSSSTPVAAKPRRASAKVRRHLAIRRRLETRAIAFSTLPFPGLSSDNAGD